MLQKIQCSPERQTIRDEEIKRTCRILREMEDLMSSKLANQDKKKLIMQIAGHIGLHISALL